MKINFKNIKEAVVLVIPQFSDTETLRYEFRFTKMLFWVFLYTIITALFTIILLSITPLKNIIFHFENEELKQQVEKTIELENKVRFLTKEIESISSINKKLKYAYILGTSDSIDTSSVVYDSLQYEPNKNLPYGGNIYVIFNKIWNDFFQETKSFFNHFVKPSKGLIINEFNPEEGHFGIDFAVHTGSVIVAAQGGLVLFSDFTIDDGYKIILQHNNGLVSIYKHCSSLIKSERDVVTQGELIGLSGNSGQNTSGPHLHFEIWKDGKPQNPEEYFIK